MKSLKIEGKLDKFHYFVVFGQIFLIILFIFGANLFFNNYYCDAKYYNHYYYGPIKEVKSWVKEANEYYTWSKYFKNTSFKGNYIPKYFNETQLNTNIYFICQPGDWKNDTIR